MADATGLLLTDREREVMAEIADGRSTDEAAIRLGISPHTLRTHVKNGMRKNGAKTRTRLAVMIEREDVGELLEENFRLKEGDRG
jgi:DNA-binding CsgD family transcriptional regulator